MKLIRFSETNHHLDNYGTLKVFIDYDTVLNISEPEIFSVCSEIISENIKRISVPQKIFDQMQINLLKEKKPHQEEYLPAIQESVIEFIENYVQKKSKMFVPFEIEEIEYVICQKLDFALFSSFLQKNDYETKLENNSILIRALPHKI